MEPNRRTFGTQISVDGIQTAEIWSPNFCGWDPIGGGLESKSCWMEPKRWTFGPQTTAGWEAALPGWGDLPPGPVPNGLRDQDTPGGSSVDNLAMISVTVDSGSTQMKDACLARQSALLT